MKRTIIIAKLIFIGFISSYCQTVEIDQIHLVNGTVHEGRVIEQKPGEYIKIHEADTGDTLSFEMEEIEKLSRKTIQNEKAEIDVSAGKIYNTNPFSISVMGHTGGGDVAFGGLGIGLNYRLTDKIAVGISTSYLGETGSGVSQYQWQKMTLMADGAYQLNGSRGDRSGLYAKIGIGYGFTLDKNYRSIDTGEELTVSNGICFSPGFGYRFNILGNVGLAVEARYMVFQDDILNEMDIKVQDNSWNQALLSGIIYF